MRVGELLAREQIITHDQLDHALQTQMMCGARIGTSLVELGYIDLDGLSNALGYQRGMPAALAVHFDRAERDLQLLLSPNLAEQYACIPLRRVGKRAVAVAVASPLDKRSTAMIADELGVDPDRTIMAVAPELRIRYALECVYHIPRPQRFLRAPGAPRSAPKRLALGCEILPINDAPNVKEAPAGDRRRYVRAIDPLQLPLGGGGPRDSGPGNSASMSRAAAARARIDLSTAAAPHPQGSVESSADEAAALTSIRAAPDPKRIAKLVIDALVHLEPVTQVVLLLTRRGTAAVTWSSYCRDGGLPEVPAVPLDQAGVVAAAFGRCNKPNQLSAIDLGLLSICGLEGGDLVAEPVRANNHIVAVLAVGSFARAKPSTLGAIAGAAGEGLERLMREAIAAPAPS